MRKILLLLCCFVCLEARVFLGIDLFFTSSLLQQVQGKKIALLTNHTGINGDLLSSFELFLHNKEGIVLSAVFVPEHGFFGAESSDKLIKHGRIQGIPLYSLYGKTRRPSKEMLQGIDYIICDLQDIGLRSYTYISTLFYVMEEAAKAHIPVIVLDRPNPLGGNLIDGALMKEDFRSFIGYVNVPLCHGMTIGELALYFNEEYHIHCSLQVLPMKGWQRSMTFSDTGLHWIPTSPYIPEASTPFFYAMTGLMGELSLVNIGIGYTLPFKVIGAPWIDATHFAQALNHLKLPGLQFVPFHFTPSFGLYKAEICHGILIVITDPKKCKPISAQHYILGILKSLYPKEVQKRLDALSKTKRERFCQGEGSDIFWQILQQKKYPAWEMIEQISKKNPFPKVRKKYLLYN